MEWGTPVLWGRFLLFCVPQSVKTKETSPTSLGSPTPCKQALSQVPKETELDLFSLGPQSFQRRSRRKTDKTNWFPEEPDIKCFLIFVDQTFSSTATKSKVRISDKCPYFKNTKLFSSRLNEWFYFYLRLFLLKLLQFSSWVTSKSRFVLK